MEIDAFAISRLFTVVSSNLNSRGWFFMNCSMGHHIPGRYSPKVIVATAYLPPIWILIEIACRNYRGVGPYWRFPQPMACRNQYHAIQYI